MKDVLTTTQAAKICRTNPRTVAKWIDAGHLGGYRLPDGRRERRIPREELARFLVRNGMPLRELGDLPCDACKGSKETFAPGRGFVPCGKCEGSGLMFAGRREAIR